MRIEDSRFDKGAPLTAATASQSADSTAQSKSIGRETESAGRDSVVVSDLTNLLSRVGARADAERAATVSRLTEQYRAGKYVIDNIAVGEALIARAFGE